ncbi:MAG: hypothetical protein SCARUB_03365 [Candidatus Scalindua rubra]|uniref:Uncharacterized protein n=1 Tax=Candidatus Scalindua rubra TaxID=1872076 RepID=A0A1E3X7D8_9BACT|nr:MAG: hypothetical protein SCARUB_03365 [Candidatus Scalindua rubra]
MRFCEFSKLMEIYVLLQYIYHDDVSVVLRTYIAPLLNPS